MKPPLMKDLSLIYGNTYSDRYQLLAGSNPVSDDLNEQTITFTITAPNDPEFETIEKDIVEEGWVFDNAQKEVKIVIDTDVYLMIPGLYKATLYWTEQDRTLVVFDIYVNPVPF